MNGPPIRIRHLIVSLLAIALIQSQPAAAAAQTFVGPTFPESELNLTDSMISPSWDDITTFSNVKEYGTGGYVKFSHNTTHLFALLAANLTEWIAIEFGSDGQDSMVPDNDAWVFYINEQDKTVRSLDAKYNGLAKPEEDMQNDLSTESVFDQDLVYIEIMREFDTLDTAGSDYVFANGTSLYLTFASPDDHTSDRFPYYLQIQFTDIGDVQEVVAPKVVDWNERKALVLYLSLIGVTVFILTHYLIRVKFRPLAHGSRFIDSTIMKPPKFKERWNTLLNRHPDGNNEKATKDIEGGTA